MIETTKKNLMRKWYFSKISIGIVLFLVPFVLYAIARIFGSIPDEKTWLAEGTNHGPWRWELPGLVLAFCIYSLLFGAPVITLWGFIRGIRMKQWMPVAGGVLIGLFYLLLMYILV
jgi:hypothetical protein